MTQPTPTLCWKPEHLEKAIGYSAKVDKEQSHYFLACHSPIERIRDERLKKELREEELYQRIMGRRTQRDFLGLVHGEPGTGKSHLIHWLKLRCEYDRDAGTLKGVIPVLIRRRTGSLKDALQQLIEQLDSSFAKYLSPVKNALEKISAETAREKLANELSLEVGSRRVDRGKQPLPKLLRHLDQACKAGGFGRWLCRTGGVIDQRIKLLTQESTGYERESPPQFTAADLLVESRYRGRNHNSGDVDILIDELQDSERLRREAADILNDALRDAILEMTGLSGGNLRDIFDRIRADLQESGRALALFIEDVTAMSELDTEVVNAVEPQDRRDLCPLIAILGLTNTGKGRLRPNQLQRASLIVRVGDEEDQTHQPTRFWREDREALAQFAARYLNAIRLDEAQVREIAKHRSQNTDEDVNFTKCDGCPARPECHRRFGAVRLNGVDVGMYPLSLEAPYHLLQNLVEDEATEIRRNQRGLLMHLLAPILANPDAVPNHEFPNERVLRLRQGDPDYWSEFQQRYCGGWDGAERDRLRLLARMWIDELDTADEAARALEPFLEPLGFQPFSSKAPAGKKGTLASGTEARAEAEAKTTPRPPEPPPKRDKGEQDKVNKILDNLRSWLNDKDKHLARNAELRRLLAKFVRKSVRWDDERTPPTTEWKRLLGGADDSNQKYEFIYIEGQGADPATAPFVIREDFPRTEETRELLEALVRFSKEGDGSWNFAGGELHKRVVARWLRKHEEGLLARLNPQDGLDTRLPVAAAVEFLCVAAVVRRRAKLPTDPDKLLAAVLADPWPEGETPAALSRGWRNLLEDMQKRLKDVRDFVIAELAVVQGRTGGQNFIDPLPILDAAGAFLKEAKVQALAPEYFKGYWKTRYFPLNGLPAYANLPEILEAERAEVQTLVTQVSQALESFGYDPSAPKDAMKSFIADLVELMKAKADTKFYLPDDTFDPLFRRETIAAEAAPWGQAVEAGRKVAGAKGLFEVLLYDPKLLRDANAAVRVAEAHLGRLQKELAEQDRHQSVEGDPLELEKALLQALEALAGLLSGKEEPDHAVAD
ncbi:MAG TPA: hypothetical protein VKA46_40625 [Gemmataceae bacterium]|nr:hypothetical protein [Gemmataceae bacterium]